MFVQAGTSLLLALALPDASVVGGVDLSLVPRATTEDGLCLPCEELFSKLQGAPNGKLLQNSQLQLRGEPKSGTSFMFEWAKVVLKHTCDHLQDMYGPESCRTEEIGEKETQVNMIFEPSLATDASCTCEAIERVEISASCVGKHAFPVSDSCPWSHSLGLAAEDDGCWSIHGHAVENGSDLWTCLQETPCEITDHRLQFGPMRDPRAVAVSSYFHHVNSKKGGENFLKRRPSLDEAVLEVLPQLCHLTTLRHIMFEGLLSDRSEIFWYEETLEDPFPWHYRWASFAGLILPRAWIDGMVAVNQERLFFNRHPGGGKRTAKRTWRDEVSPGIHHDMESILRKWLPPVLLARFEVPP
ncbi:unnamed protein product [Ectocarpus sp. 8 AP-2014]